MNIMLSDLTSLTPDVQEIPAVADSGAQSFAGMFHQQFPEGGAEGKQTIEFNEFFENIPMQADTSAATLTLSPITPESELAAALPDVAAMASLISPDHVDSLLPGSLKPVAEPLPVIKAGELLPAGGNHLPPAPPAPAVDAGVVESVVQTPMTMTVTPSVIEPADVAAMQNQPTSETVTRSVLTQPKVPDQLDTVVAPADADPTISLQKIASAAPVPAALSAVQREPGPATESLQPMAAGATAKPVATAEPAPSRSETVPASTLQAAAVSVAAGREFRPEEAPDTAGRTLNNTTGNTTERAPQLSSPGVDASADRAISYRDSGSAGEAVAVREVIGNIDNRGGELPTQNAPNTIQQPASNAIGGAVVASIAGNPGVTPASPQNPLPPQLESMTLARNADANEWSNGLGERINWMINQKQNIATIRLDPPALGKLDVQIKIVDEATMITIQTQTAQTRDMIDSASIRLRDFLQESGFQNVNVDVSQRQDQQQARSQATADLNPEQDENSDQEQAPDHQQQQASYFSGEGLVDTFA